MKRDFKLIFIFGFPFSTNSTIKVIGVRHDKER